MKLSCSQEYNIMVNTSIETAYCRSSFWLYFVGRHQPKVWHG